MVENTPPKEVNLFDTLTSDIDKFTLMQKQAQFNDLADSINKVLAGAISNFYKDDF